jgi:hypothetical protein
MLALFSLFSFAVSSLPSGEEELKDWLATRWKIKEQTLTKFYASGSFEASNICNKNPTSPEAPMFNLCNGSLYKAGQVICRNSIPSLPTIRQNSLYNSCYSSNNTKVSCRYDASFNHLPSHEKSHSTIMYATLIFWTLLCFVALYGILTSFVIQIFAIMNISFFLFLSLFTQGFHHLEIYLYRFKKRYLVGGNISRGK